MNKRVAILGASRGLGAETAMQLDSLGLAQKLFLSSRKTHLLDELCSNFKTSTEIHPCDFTKNDEREKLFEKLIDFAPTHVLYVAGGGPYGEFSSKEWKDHVWAIELNLLAPMHLLHFCLKNLSSTEFMIVGSAIAEDRPDPYASSYAAGKHGIKGFLSSVNLENTKMRLRLFSPGYMDTDMLPKNAKARQSGAVVSKVELVASELINQWFNCIEPFHIKIKDLT